MNDNYKKSIAIFALAIPLSLIIIMIIVIVGKTGSIGKKYSQKKLAYDQYKLSENVIKGMKVKAEENKEQLKIWDDMMKAETRGTFIQRWNSIEAKYNKGELSKLSHNWVNQSIGIGAGSSQPASQIKMSFRGTYEAMQNSLLELETVIPQLQLDSISMKPAESRNLLNFDAVFTLWTLQ